jgi:hypothetical protein
VLSAVSIPMVECVVSTHSKFQNFPLFSYLSRSGRILAVKRHVMRNSTPYLGGSRL